LSQNNDDLSPFMIKLIHKRIQQAEEQSDEDTRELLKLIRQVFRKLPPALSPLEPAVLAETARMMGRWGMGQTTGQQREVLEKAVMRIHNLLETVREELLREFENSRS